MSSLWMRVDVLYFSHPKVIQLHPFAQLLYLRAVAYSKQFLTDGHLSLSAIRSLASDLALAKQNESKRKANVKQKETNAIPTFDPYTVISEWTSHMVAVGLFRPDSDGFLIHDYLEWNNSKQDVEYIKEIRGTSGKKGGRPKAKRKQNESKTKANGNQTAKQNITHSTEYIVQSTYKDKNNTSLEPYRAAPERPELEKGISVETWNSYSAAYLERYKAMPVRNRKVNSELKKLVELVGAEEAPRIAAFYLSCTRPLYIEARHPTSLLVRDASGLHTQWATNTRATRSEAKTAEMGTSMNEQLKRILTSTNPIIDVTPKKQEALEYEES